MSQPNKTLSHSRLLTRNHILSLLAVVVLVVVLANAQHWFGSYVERVLKIGAIYAISALSMNLVNGCTGVFSLGNPGFMAIGAYVTALLFLDPASKEMVFYLEPIVPFLAKVHWPFGLALISGGLMAALAAFLIGFPVLRLKGDYLSIATLGFSEIIRILILNGQNITNGAIGINRIPNVVSIWVAFGTLAVLTAFLLMMMRSTFGRALKAVREDAVAAEAMGIGLFKHKMLAFVLSGFLAGLSGGLLASVVGAIDSNQFRYTFVYQFLLMMVLGGQGSMSGAILGAFLVTAAQEWLRFMDEPIRFGLFQYPGYPGMRMVVFAVVLMVVVLFWGRGIMGDKEFSWDRLIDGAKGLWQQMFHRNRAGKGAVS